MTIYDIIKELGVTKGWSPVYGECPIELNDELSLISITNGVNRMILTRSGKFADNGECLIFPSKENRDWEKELEEKEINCFLSIHQLWYLKETIIGV